METKNPVVMVFGERIEIVVTSRSTNYTCCAGVQTSPPGGGPPPHMHEREEEVFTVLEGEFEFFDVDRWVRLTKGDVKVSLRGHWHGFRNVGTGEGKMMFVTNGGGLDEYFEEIAELVMPQDAQRLVEISKPYGYVFKDMA